MIDVALCTCFSSNGEIDSVTHRLPPTFLGSQGSAEKIVIPAKAGIQGVDFAGFCFWQTRFF
jgi:hypothetical protein